MQKVLILGAGLVANPIVQHLLANGYHVSLANRTVQKAINMIGNHPNGKAIQWETHDTDMLEKMVQEHDLTVSLLPWAHHIMVAKACIRNRKDMLTTSYVKPEMQALDQQAKEAGIIILNELGLDPGIDHMSAMRIIDYIRNKGGKVEEFYSLCGALPAPESTDNPFRYKFSWSPKGVVLAGNNTGRYLHNNKEINTPTENLFKDIYSFEFPDVGRLEVYPNRDSIDYINIYGIPEAKTVFRGTLRFPGWCQSLDAMKACKLTSCEEYDFTGLSYAAFVAKLIGGNTLSIKEDTAAYLGLAVDAVAIEAMEWLGLFSETPMNRAIESPFEITSDLMIEKMTLGKTERDMVVMQHSFMATYPDGTKEVVLSRMLDFGTPGGDTSVARTVALPAAIGVEMILQKKITNKGVYRPVIPAIYNPILDRLEEMNIRMVEQYMLPESAMIRK